MSGQEDKYALLRAYLDNDMQQVKEMLVLFLDNIPADLTELTTFCREHDFANIQKSAHRMKSSVKFFGLNEVSEMLQQMEKMAENNAKPDDIDAMSSLLNRKMENELEILRKELTLL